MTTAVTKSDHPSLNVDRESRASREERRETRDIEGLSTPLKHNLHKAGDIGYTQITDFMRLVRYLGEDGRDAFRGTSTGVGTVC